MAPQEIHTLCDDDGWNNADQTGATLSQHALKMDAVAHGRELACTLGIPHVIHMRDGSVRARIDRHRRDAA